MSVEERNLILEMLAEIRSELRELKRLVHTQSVLSALCNDRSLSNKSAVEELTKRQRKDDTRWAKLVGAAAAIAAGGGGIGAALVKLLGGG